MTEIYFYHLERQPLDKALVNLIERSIGRGWSCVVQAGSDERVDALDTLLWTYEDESFLPHGTAKDGHPEMQKVFLTTGEDNPNGATVRSRSESVHKDTSDPFVALNNKVSDRGDQDSGACDSPCSGLVRRSAAPPSAGCRKMARSPSRSD